MLYVLGKMELNNHFRLDGIAASGSLRTEGTSLVCSAKVGMQIVLLPTLAMTLVILLWVITTA